MNREKRGQYKEQALALVAESVNWKRESVQFAMDAGMLLNTAKGLDDIRYYLGKRLVMDELSASEKKEIALMMGTIEALTASHRVVAKNLGRAAIITSDLRTSAYRKADQYAKALGMTIDDIRTEAK